MKSPLIDRGFIRINSGLVHYRTCKTQESNNTVPLYMAHAGPGSSLGLVPLIAELGKHRSVIAPDMLGNGDSEAPKIERTTLGFYVDCVIETLDSLNIPCVDFYGQHTGALVGCELALTHPDRVRRLILDGITLFPPDLKAQMIEQYAPPVEPDDFGGHLAWAWSFVRELWLHFPYFLRDPDHRLHLSAVPEAAILHPLVVDLLKALPTYHLAYQAAFSHPTAERLPLLKHQTLVMSVDTDPLVMYHEEAAALVPDAISRLVKPEQHTQTIESFLDGSLH